MKKSTTTANLITFKAAGKTAAQLGANVRAWYKKADGIALNVAAALYVMRGNTLPYDAANNGEVRIAGKPATEEECAALIDRDRRTVSRMLTAFQLIMDNGNYSEYAGGLVPFNYDKIILYYRNMEAFKGLSLSEAFQLSHSKMKARVAAAAGQAAAAAGEGQAPIVVGELARFTYNGQIYEADKAAIEALVASATPVEAANK